MNILVDGDKVYDSNSNSSSSSGNELSANEMSMTLKKRLAQGASKKFTRKKDITKSKQIEDRTSIHSESQRLIRGL